MKRAHVHAAFAVVTVAVALLAAYDASRLREAESINAAIGSANTSHLSEQVPEALFAHALTLSANNESRKAIDAYKTLIQGKRSDLRQAALYNVGNVYLRDALKDGHQAAIHSLPLIELAKQSYRELLRENPGYWDARYNLERALRLAPEFSGETSEEASPEIWNRRVIRATQGFRIELP